MFCLDCDVLSAIDQEDSQNSKTDDPCKDQEINGSHGLPGDNIRRVGVFEWREITEKFQLIIQFDKEADEIEQ